MRVAAESGSPPARAGESDIDVVPGPRGLSGAGRGQPRRRCWRTSAWYVADNLPPELIAQMVETGAGGRVSRITQLAVVMDVRSRGFTGDLDWVRNRSGPPANITPRVLFLEASDDILVRRYEQKPAQVIRCRANPNSGRGAIGRGTVRCSHRYEPWRTW